MPDERRRDDLLRSLRERGIGSERVLRALGRVPREAFIEAPLAEEAYADCALPISCGQTISQTYIVALMTEALQVGPEHRVLEIGTGSGYQAAVLSHLCKHLYTIERYHRLADTAGERFRQLGLHNISQQVGDGTLGMPEHAPFDRIIVTAAPRAIPRAFLEQLAVGGILVIPVEERPGQQDLWRVTRDGRGFSHERMIPVRFVPLVEGLPPGR